jgi:GYF domain 2
MIERISMIDAWYYSQTDTKVGPYSGRQLKELAASGQILPTDSIWKEGIEKAVYARNVKNLFLPGVAIPKALEPVVVSKPGAAIPANVVIKQSHSASSPSLAETLMNLGRSEPDAVDSQSIESLEESKTQIRPEPPSIPGDLKLRPIEETHSRIPASTVVPKKVGQARAMAGKGAIILGQDGTHVQFRKKCTTCGHEDNCRNRMPIRQGTTKIGFFCSKCKKKRDVEILGFAR